MAGGILLAALAVMRGQSLRVPQGQWPRLLLSAALNVTTWMALMGLALLWLPASEAAVMAYTMPVWASLLAWLVLGERMSLRANLALLMAFAGIAALMGGNGIDASMEKLPGIVMVLVGAFVFAIGTVAGEALAGDDAADRVVGAGRSASAACRWHWPGYCSNIPISRRCRRRAGP